MPPRKAAPCTSLITQEEYNRICEVYKRHGGPRKTVAEELAWPYARVRRVFLRGYPSQGFPPVMHVLGLDAESVEEIRYRRQDMQKMLPESESVDSIDHIEAKAVVIHTKEQERIRKLMRLEEQRRHAREDALQARAEEATLVSITRRNALALNGVTAQLMKGALALSEKIHEELENEAKNGKMTVKEKLALVRSAASVARFNSETTMLAIKSERMVLGEPIETEETEHEDGSLEQSVEWIERAAAAIKKAQTRGMLRASNIKVEKH